MLDPEEVAAAKERYDQLCDELEHCDDERYAELENACKRAHHDWWLARYGADA